MRHLAGTGSDVEEEEERNERETREQKRRKDGVSWRGVGPDRLVGGCEGFRETDSALCETCNIVRG